jgi:hypothetical protein
VKKERDVEGRGKKKKKKKKERREEGEEMKTQKTKENKRTNKWRMKICCVCSCYKYFMDIYYIKFAKML